MKTKKWYDDLIETELIKAIEILKLDRMPTAHELRSIGRNDLHMAIHRSRKYEGWAEHLNLKRKSSDTVFGQNNESIITSELERKGYKVERMSTKYPYDLLVNDSVKIDVKSARPFFMRGSRVHTFALNKVHQTCDIYIARALLDSGEIERTLVIPSHLLKIKTLCIGGESKYNKFIDRWDLIERYSNFYKGVV